LAGAIVRLLGHGKIELPPVRQRQVRRIAERDSFAEARLKPAEKAVEASIGDNAERSESFSGILRVLAKIHVIAERRLAERRERFAGGAQMAVFRGESLDERPVIEIVKARWQSADAERFRGNGRRNVSADSGTMRPPGLRKRSRASATDSMIFSVSKQKVLSVSVTRTSQRSGKCAFHELLRMSVMRSRKPLASMSSAAVSAMPVISIA